MMTYASIHRKYEVLKVRKIVNFQISKYVLLCKMVAMVILQQFLCSGHILPNVAKQESYLR